MLSHDQCIGARVGLIRFRPAVVGFGRNRFLPSRVEWTCSNAIAEKQGEGSGARTGPSQASADDDLGALGSCDPARLPGGCGLHLGALLRSRFSPKEFKGGRVRPNRMLNPIRQRHSLDPEGVYAGRYLLELGAAEYPKPRIAQEDAVARFRGAGGAL